jgi:hypothetical protein
MATINFRAISVDKRGVNVTWFGQGFCPCWGRKPTVWQSRPIPAVIQKHSHSPRYHSIYSTTVDHCKVPQSVSSILEGILERTAMVRHFVRCASNANGGVQDHCGTAWFQRERVFLLITSSLNLYWLRVHFVLVAAPGFSEMKTAVQSTETRRFRKFGFSDTISCWLHTFCSSSYTTHLTTSIILNVEMPSVWPIFLKNKHLLES